MTKKIFYTIFMVLTFALTGCSNDDNIPTYTKSELESFLIRDSKISYNFEEEGFYFSFGFMKNSRGNIGEYFRENLNNGKIKASDFIWDVEPDGDSGIVTMAFEEEDKKIRLRMKLVKEQYIVHLLGGKEITETVELWKLDFKLKDDPFKRE